MADPFLNRTSGLESPATDAFSVSPNDAGDLPMVTRALYIGGGGDLSVVMKDGTTVTFSSLSSGAILPIRASRVRATDTTASDIVGLV